MAQQANIHAQTRSVRGKGAARTLRRAGRVPGVIYGHDRPSEAVTIETLALTRLLGSIRAATTIVDVTVDQRAPVKALIREIQRDPLHPIDILHMTVLHAPTMSGGAGIVAGRPGLPPAKAKAWDNTGTSSGVLSYGPICYDTVPPVTTAALSGTLSGGPYTSSVRVTLSAQIRVVVWQPNSTV